MARSLAVPVPASSVDAAGLSVCTSPRRSDDPRPGAIYDPQNLAAAAPIAFHPIGGGAYLMVAAQRWHTATVSATNPGAYSAYTVDTEPVWVVVDGATGALRKVGANFSVPMRRAADSRVATATASRLPYLYVLSTVTVSGEQTAVVQQWLCNARVGSVVAVAEEDVPTIVADDQDVRFDVGMWISPPHMMFIGAGLSDNSVYLARKPWARVGATQIPWEYRSSTGWGTDSSAAAPLQTTDGAMATAGPVSVANYQGRLLMSTVTTDGDDRAAQMYSSRSGSAWCAVGGEIALGVAGGSYLGVGLQFQPLMVQQTQITAGNVAALPYVVSTKTTAGGDDTLDVGWGVWQVPRII